MEKQGGFTKLGLLFVVLGCGLVMLIAVGMVQTARSQMRDAVRTSDIKQIQAGLELHFAEQNSYPVQAKPIVLGRAQTLCLGNEGFAEICASGATYMSVVPGNITPKGTSFVYLSRNAEGVACDLEPCASYSLQFSLEKKRGVLRQGANCARPEGITAGPCR